MTFFFNCVTACFSLQMCDSHVKCVILGRSKVCICGHSTRGGRLPIIKLGTDVRARVLGICGGQFLPGH